jgi:hypothetical protein
MTSLQAEQKQHLISGIHDGVNTLRQHRGAAREKGNHELGHSDNQVCCQSTMDHDWTFG